MLQRPSVRLVITAVVLGLLGFVVYWAGSRVSSLLRDTDSPQAATSAPVSEQRARATITFGEERVYAEVARTPEERTRGLSGRRELDEGTGMLFIFPEDGVYGIWMPDMYISLDVLWLSAEGSIVHVEENVSPETYPNTFTNTEPARYVLEVPAGFLAKTGLRVGDVGAFDESIAQ